MRIRHVSDSAVRFTSAYAYTFLPGTTKFRVVIHVVEGHVTSGPAMLPNLRGGAHH